MARKNTCLILDWLADGTLNAEGFLKSLLQALSESEVSENLEYIARVEDWPQSMQRQIKGEE